MSCVLFHSPVRYRLRSHLFSNSFKILKICILNPLYPCVPVTFCNSQKHSEVDVIFLFVCFYTSFHRSASPQLNTLTSPPRRNEDGPLRATSRHMLPGADSEDVVKRGCKCVCAEGVFILFCLGAAEADRVKSITDAPLLLLLCARFTTEPSPVCAELLMG